MNPNNINFRETNFDLNAALNGAKVVTRYGTPVKVGVIDNNNPDKICVCILKPGRLAYWTKININGYKYGKDNPHMDDLFMAA